MKDDLEPLMQCLSSMTAHWQTFPDGTHYASLLDYYPINAFAGTALTEDEEDSRKFISDFGCKLLTTPAEHGAAVERAVGLVSDMLANTFGDLLTHLTLVPVPASTQETTTLRYSRFCREVAARTGVHDGYGLITQAEDTDDDPLPVQSDGFIYSDALRKAECCILFDDLISTGNTMRSVVHDLTAMGVPVVACLALGKVAKVDDNL